MSITTLTWERSRAAGEKRMSAVQVLKRPSIAVPLQAEVKPRVEPGRTVQCTGLAGAGATTGCASGAAAVSAGLAGGFPRGGAGGGLVEAGRVRAVGGCGRPWQGGANDDA